MPGFTDSQNRTWNVSIDVATALRIDEAAIECRGELLQLTDPDPWFFKALYRSVKFQCDLLWELCRPQAEERQVTRDQFIAELTGHVPHPLLQDQPQDAGPGSDQQPTTTVLQLAMAALFEALDFFFLSAPTSWRRLQRAQQTQFEQSVRFAMDMEAAAEQYETGPGDSASTDAPAGTDSTASSGCVPTPASTGGSPDSRCGSW